MMERGNGNFHGEVALLFCQPWLSDVCQVLPSNQSKRGGMMGSKGETDGLGHSQALTVIPEEQSSAFM